MIQEASSRAAGVAAYEAHVRSLLQASSSQLILMLRKGAERAQENGQQPISVVLISAFYYGACAAGITKDALCSAESRIEHAAPDVLAKLEVLRSCVRPP